MKRKTLGTQIAALRKDRGMTQQGLAEHMGVTDKAVSKWERDLSCPDVASIPHLAEVLGVTVEELMQPGTQGTAKEGESIRDIISLILKAVPLAMGVAVAVLAVLGEIEMQAALTMLGIGLACLAINGLQKQ